MRNGLLFGLFFVTCGLEAREKNGLDAECSCRDSISDAVGVDSSAVYTASFSETFVPDATGYLVEGKSIPLAECKNAAEVLRFLPGVENDGDGFTVNGLPVTEVQINGIAVKGREEIEVVSVGDIESIKVDYLSGSDKNVNIAGGMIRIYLRQPESRGYCSSLGTSGTFSPHYGVVDGHVGGMLMYKDDKWNLYNMMWVDGDRSHEKEEERYAYTMYGASVYEKLFQGTSDTEKGDFRIKDRFCLAYNINADNSISANMCFSSLSSRPKVTTCGFDGSLHTLSVLKNNRDEQMYSGTLKYVSLLRENDAVFEVSSDYMHVRSKENEMKDEVVNGGGPVAHGDKGGRMDADWTKRTDSWSASASFSRRIADWGTLKIGASASVVKAVVSPENMGSGMDRTETQGFTPFVYATLSGKWHTIDYILGINSQWNRIEYHNRTRAHTDKNRQWCINPTVQLVWPFDKNRGHAFKVAYKHTMDNIPYDAINTELRYDKVNSYVVGNPFLSAAKSDLALMVVSLCNGRYRFSVSYDRAADIIKYATYQDSGRGGVFYTIPVNCKLVGSWGFSAEANIRPLRFWNMKVAAMARLMDENATIGGRDFKGCNGRYNLWINNEFVLGKDFGGTLCLDVEPGFRSLDRKYHSVVNLNGSLYKSLCKKKLCLSVNFDLLRCVRAFDIDAATFYLGNKNVTHGQFAEISAVWKLDSL